MENVLEKRRYGTIADFNLKSANNYDKRYCFVLNHQNLSPSIEGRTFPNSVSLPLEDRIFDRKTSKTRIIRVVDGERSIYKDEQSEDGQKARCVVEMFSKMGDVIIEQQEDQKLEFFMKCNFNGSNPDRNKEKRPLFYLLDLRQGIENEMKKDQAETEAANWCYKEKFKNVVRYARVIGMDTDVDPDQLRHGMRQIAKRDPQKFLDGLRNKYTIRKFHVLEAMDAGLVSVDLQSNAISWASGNIITASPIGKHPVDHFVDLSCTTTDFDMAYRTLEQQVLKLEKESEIERGDAPPEKAPVVAVPTTNHPIDINTPNEVLLKVCIQKGIIIQKSSWFLYGEQKFQGKKMMEALETNATLKDALITACQ